MIKDSILFKKASRGQKTTPARGQRLRASTPDRQKKRLKGSWFDFNAMGVDNPWDRSSLSPAVGFGRQATGLDRSQDYEITC